MSTNMSPYTSGASPKPTSKIKSNISTPAFLFSLLVIVCSAFFLSLQSDFNNILNSLVTLQSSSVAFLRNEQSAVDYSENLENLVITEPPILPDLPTVRLNYPDDLNGHEIEHERVHDIDVKIKQLESVLGIEEKIVEEIVEKKVEEKVEENVEEKVDKNVEKITTTVEPVIQTTKIESKLKSAKPPVQNIKNTNFIKPKSPQNPSPNFKNPKISDLESNILPDTSTYPTIAIWWHINHLKRNPAHNFDLCAPNNNCNIVYDQRSKETLKNAAAVIFTPIRTLSLPPDFNLISKVRQKHQLWMFYQWESPEYHRDAYQIYDNFFNGTISYRKDSTFFNPYGSIIATKLQKFYENKANLERFPMKELTDDILDEYLISKPEILNLDRKRDGGVLSVISNCWSEYRGGLVKSLDGMLKFANGTNALNVYGKCADQYQEKINQPFNIVGKTGSYKNVPDISGRYKFYLAFENSRCRGYITEKLFNNALFAGVVPIVSGPPREDYELLVPKNSFIHVDDYGSMEKLAEKINYYLDPENNAEYMKFFDWWNPQFESENKYRLRTLEEHRNHGWCKLCKVLNEIKQEKVDVLKGLDGDSLSDVRLSDSYPAKTEIHEWWYGEGSRDPPIKAADRVIDREGMCLAIREKDMVLPDGMNNKRTRRSFVNEIEREYDFDDGFDDSVS